MNWHTAIAEFNSATKSQDFPRISAAMETLKYIAPPTEVDRYDYECQFWAAYDIPGFLDYVTGNEPGHYL